MEVMTFLNFQTSGNVNMNQGDTKILECQTSSHVITGVGKTLSVSCDGDGGVLPATAPSAACAAPAACTATIPVPDASHNLRNSMTAVVSKAFDEALYECQDGFTLRSQQFGRADIDDNLRFHLTCAADGASFGTPSWPTCAQVKYMYNQQTLIHSDTTGFS